MSTHKPFRAVAIIIHDGKLLIIKRTKPDKHYWVFPGGRIEPGESPAEAVIREVNEETSLLITNPELVFEIDNQGDHEYWFLIQDITGQVALGGEEKQGMSPDNQYHLCWIPINDIESLSNLYPVEGKARLIATLNQNRFQV